VEIDGALADDRERAVILEQVEAGVAVRMAVLELISAASPNQRYDDRTKGEAQS
jgi:aspartate carbamoyltransferase catalytic subunit